MEVVKEDELGDLLFATERGYGKRVRVRDFRIAHRGGVGVKTIPTVKRNGNVIGLAIVRDTSNILLIDVGGKIIRLSPKEIRTMGRQAKGVRLIRLDKDQKLASLVAFDEEDRDESADSGGSSSGHSDESEKMQAAAQDAQKIEMAAQEIRAAAKESPETVQDEPEVTQVQEVQDEQKPVAVSEKKTPEVSLSADDTQESFVQNNFFDFSPVSENDDDNNEPDSFAQF